MLQVLKTRQELEKKDPMILPGGFGIAGSTTYAKDAYKNAPSNIKLESTFPDIRGISAGAYEEIMDVKKNSNLYRKIDLHI